jgi:hypothetical protein
MSCIKRWMLEWSNLSRLCKCPVPAVRPALARLSSRERVSLGGRVSLASRRGRVHILTSTMHSTSTAIQHARPLRRSGGHADVSPPPDPNVLCVHRRTDCIAARWVCSRNTIQVGFRCPPADMTIIRAIRSNTAERYTRQSTKHCPRFTSVPSTL